jgi:D-serine deaminase-like pyridoxal phosphate-dependent protein
VTLDELPTPCAVVDRARLIKNCDRLKAIAKKHGVALRPHLKTSKCTEIAELAMDAHRLATVSTIAEAEHFRALDLIYAVGITPDKYARVPSGVAVITDDAGVARSLPDDARVWVEVDSGHHRGGVDVESDTLIEIGRALGSRTAGVLTHAGHSYAHGADVVAIAEQERSIAVRAKERLVSAGLSCPRVSIGSTPTATHAERLDGVDEIRPGVYVFGDLSQASIGSCARSDIAFTVIASVIGRGWIDAGALALSADRSMDAHGGGYGEVNALDGTPLGRVDRLNQEHGRVPALSLPVGARVRITPNHACITAAMFDRYYVVEEDRVIGEWPRLRG